MCIDAFEAIHFVFIRFRLVICYLLGMLYLWVFGKPKDRKNSNRRVSHFVVHTHDILHCNSSFVRLAHSSCRCCCFFLVAYIWFRTVANQKNEIKFHNRMPQHVQHRWQKHICFQCATDLTFTNMCSYLSVLRSPCNSFWLSNFWSAFNLWHVNVSAYNLFDSINFSIECHNSWWSPTKYYDAKSFRLICGISVPQKEGDQQDTKKELNMTTNSLIGQLIANRISNFLLAKWAK